MRYLVAADGSPESDQAVRYAARKAVLVDATLEVVHVPTPETELIDGEVVVPGEDAAMDHASRTLEGARELATETASDLDVDLAVETHVATGRPADAIAERADETDTDAIYVGHRGLSAEHERVVGSVAKAVVDRAAVPVTIVR